MSYVLLIATGQSPQVLTETVWSLARQHHPPLRPVSVEVVTTAAGEAHLRARLLGQPQHDPVSGMPVPDVADRWSTLCREVLGLDAPVPLHLHVPERHGLKLDDVQNPSDDAAFADLCYRLVHRLTQPGRPPVIGSIAGGRKTMSAHLMTAFSVYARAEDRLTHVLVTPDPLPRDLAPTFFYPTEATASVVRLHRVDVQFPRLRGLLAHRRLGLNLPADGADLAALLEALEPHMAREHTPARFRVTLDYGRTARVEALAADGACLAALTLTARVAAYLLVLAEAIAEGEGSAPVDALFGGKQAMEHPVHGRRVAVEGACGVDDQSSAWFQAVHVQKAMSDLRTDLARAPLLERFLAPASDGKGKALRYRWPEALPGPIEASWPEMKAKWPFRHVALAPR